MNGTERLNCWEGLLLRRLAACLISLLPVVGFAGESSGFAKLNFRYFSEQSELETQDQGYISIDANFSDYREWSNANNSLYFEASLRIDVNNNDWTGSDIRELIWTHFDGNIEFQVGIGKLFWGVTESQHLVDSINQSDLQISIDGETKLGQPMIKGAYSGYWWQLEGYLLPGFRERRFAAESQRLQVFQDIDYDDVLYESGSGRRHVDAALRWSANIDAFDLGLSYFVGTSREPRFVLNEKQRLRPFYEQVQQIGLDLQLTYGAWLFKIEAISKSGQGKRFGALTAGLEYTYSQILGSDIGMGLLVEYLYDTRPDDIFDANLEESNPAVFPDNTFLGTRLTFNDIDNSDLVAGVIVNNKNSGMQGSVEYQRRFNKQYKLEVEARYFNGVARDTLFYGLRNDSYVQVSISRYF